MPPLSGGPLTNKTRCCELCLVKWKEVRQFWPMPILCKTLSNTKVLRLFFLLTVATTTNLWSVIKMMRFSECKWGEKFPRQGAITWNRVWPPRAPRTPQAALLLAFLLVPAWLAGACHLSTFIASIARVKLSPDQPQCGPWCSKSWCQLGPNCTLAFLTEWRQPIGN